jgi:hypothetical protein
VSSDPAVALLDGPVEVGQDAEARVADARNDDASVRLRPLARDQAAALEPVEQARDVGLLRDHPLADLAAREPGSAGAAQDSQRVVLRRGEALALEDLGPAREDVLGRAYQVEDDLLLEAREGLRLLQLVFELPCHRRRMSV